MGNLCQKILLEGTIMQEKIYENGIEYILVAEELVSSEIYMRRCKNEKFY